MHGANGGNEDPWLLHRRKEPRVLLSIDLARVDPLGADVLLELDGGKDITLQGGDVLPLLPVLLLEVPHRCVRHMIKLGPLLDKMAPVLEILGGLGVVLLGRLALLLAWNR